MNPKSIYLRSEVNNTEKRTILTPTDIKELIKDGWAIYVEKSKNLKIVYIQTSYIYKSYVSLQTYHGIMKNSHLV